MARIVIGILAADAVLLISGFFVRTSSAPLLASIVLSVAVTALIVYGLVRQFRAEALGEGGDDEPEIEEFDPGDAALETQSMSRIRPVRNAKRPVTRKPPVTKPKPAPRKKAKPKPKPKPRTGRVWVVPGASKYHRRHCRFARSDDVREVSEATAISHGYVRCGVCYP